MAGEAGNIIPVFASVEAIREGKEMTILSGDGSATGGGPKGGTGMIEEVVAADEVDEPSRFAWEGEAADDMRVTDQSDGRLRKTLMRTLVGQSRDHHPSPGAPPTTEALRIQRHPGVPPMQRRQLKVLEAGLISHPLIPLDRLNSAALRFREVIRASELKPMDTSKNSDAMRNLCNSVLSLAWRSCNGGSPTDACHWADGYPLNIHLYLALLQSVFDHREETVILDEVDELVELMRKTWPCLGINRMIHNACFAWALFSSTWSLDKSKRIDMLDAGHVGGGRPRGVLREGAAWAERKLLDYHESFDKSSAANMDKVLSIIAEDLSGMGSGVGFIDREAIYEDPSNILTELAKDTEQLALLEKETYSPVLKRWHPGPTALAVVTLHNCFGVVLKQYVAKITSLTNELVRVLQSAGRLEKALVQMVVEDSAECEDGGKGIVREMAPYEVDSIV
ncbi:hypothetical protein ACMD2_25065, partial [Ananas comosus]